MYLSLTHHRGASDDDDALISDIHYMYYFLPNQQNTPNANPPASPTLTLGTTATHFSQHPITAVPGPARCLSRSTKNAHVEDAPGADMPSYRRLWAGRYKGKTSMRACLSWPVCESLLWLPLSLSLRLCFSPTTANPPKRMLMTTSR